MKMRKNIKSKFAVAFASLYFFAFLFSANIHNHNGGSYLKDFHFKSSSKNFSQKSLISIGDDCLSCHFSAAPVILPNIYKFCFTKQIIIKSELLATISNANSQPHFNFQLRGPPLLV